MKEQIMRSEKGAYTGTRIWLETHDTYKDIYIRVPLAWCGARPSCLNGHELYGEVVIHNGSLSLPSKLFTLVKKPIIIITALDGSPYNLLFTTLTLRKFEHKTYQVSAYSRLFYSTFEIFNRHTYCLSDSNCGGGYKLRQKQDLAYNDSTHYPVQWSPTFSKIIYPIG